MIFYPSHFRFVLELFLMMMIVIIITITINTAKMCCTGTVLPTAQSASYLGVPMVLSTGCMARAKSAVNNGW